MREAGGNSVVNFLDITAFTGLLGTGGMSPQAAYEWDCENRLIEVRPLVPEAGAQRVNLTYDHMGRRVAKRVYNWDDVSHEWETTPAAVHKFVWDGWLMLMELEQTSSPPADTIARKYTWGLDLAGQSGSVGPVSNRSTLESAGGIGGLLAVDQAAIDRPDPKPDVEAGPYVYFYDANGDGNINFLDIGSITLALRAGNGHSTNSAFGLGTRHGGRRRGEGCAVH